MVIISLLHRKITFTTVARFSEDLLSYIVLVFYIKRHIRLTSSWVCHVVITDCRKLIITRLEFPPIS